MALCARAYSAREHGHLHMIDRWRACAHACAHSHTPTICTSWSLIMLRGNGHEWNGVQCGRRGGGKRADAQTGRRKSQKARGYIHPSPHGHSCKSTTCALRLARALDLPRLPHGSNAGIDRPCMRCRAGGGAQSSVYAFPHASGKHAQDGVSKQRTGHGTQTRRGTRTSLTVSSGPFPVVSRVTTSCSPDRPRSAWPLSLPSRRLNGVADGSLRVRSSARPRIKPVDWMEHVKRCHSAPRA